MASFHTKTFSKNDDYMTPFSAWENISHLIPKDKIIWECFYGDGKSGEHFKNLGFNVIHEDIDFFENNKGDIIISNPPFTKKKEIIERLIYLDKPFIMLMPQNTLNNNYIRENLKKHLQLIIPRKRIHFIKDNNINNKCNFDCFYYCYKMNFDNDIVFLE